VQLTPSEGRNDLLKLRQRSFPLLRKAHFMLWRWRHWLKSKKSTW